jgi:predicted dehydrogenase
VANLTASRISREPMRKLRFFQERAYISVDFAGRSVEALRVEGDSIVPVAVQVGDSDPLTSELQDFLRACREGSGPLVGAAEGVMAMRAAEMIAACMLDGRPGRA